MGAAWNVAVVTFTLHPDCPFVLPKAISPTSERLLALHPGSPPELGRWVRYRLCKGELTRPHSAPACTSLPAAVNHCSNAPAGKWAGERTWKGRATSASFLSKAPAAGCGHRHSPRTPH